MGPWEASFLGFFDADKKQRKMFRPVEDTEAEAAVALLLKGEGRGLQILLVRRAIAPSDPWSGDMAFPGGRRHPEDRSLRETVIRETMEETGIDLRCHRLLGTMDVSTSTVAPELAILPFVFLCVGTPDVSLSGELSYYLWVPLDRLRRSRGRARVHKGEALAYILNGEVVWGLTYRMLENLLRLLEAA
ncbi:MAG: CoA pyrophosphatase [Candidatus Bathyarchaeota archaeon]|nr:CoA pyrophosphatase [Candidatus Bathyarchaeota archaeon]